MSIFTVFLKNRNFISKIRRSKVTDFAALTGQPVGVAYNDYGKLKNSTLKPLIRIQNNLAEMVTAWPTKQNFDPLKNIAARGRDQFPLYTYIRNFNVNFSETNGQN